MEVLNATLGPPGLFSQPYQRSNTAHITSNASRRSIQRASMPKIDYGSSHATRGKVTSISAFADLQDPIEDFPHKDEEATELSNRRPQPETLRPVKRSIAAPESISPRPQAKRPRTGGTDRDEGRLFGDYSTDPHGVAIALPGARTNHKSLLNGAALGGLKAGNKHRANPGYLPSQLARPHRHKTQTFSSREVARINEDFVDTASQQRAKRRRTAQSPLADTNMSREDPIVVQDDDDESILHSPYGGRKQHRPARQEAPANHSHASISEFKNVERLVDPRATGRDREREPSVTIPSQSDLEEEQFTREAAAQRRKEMGNPASNLPNHGKVRSTRTSSDEEESTRSVFKGMDGRTRNSKLESPDVLSGALTVQRAESPLASQTKSRQKSQGNNRPEGIRRSKILKERSERGRRQQGESINYFRCGDLIISEKNVGDYVVSLEEGDVVIRLVQSRLLEDPIFSFSVNSIYSVDHGTVTLHFKLAPPGSPRLAVIIRLQTGKTLWQVLTTLQSMRGDLRINDRGEDFIDKVIAKLDCVAEYHETARVQAERGSEHVSRSAASRKDDSGDIPVKRYVAENTGQAKLSRLMEDEMKSSSRLGEPDLDALKQQRSALARPVNPKTSHNERRAPATDAQEIGSRRSTRAAAAIQYVDADADELSRPIPIPFSKTGQLGPAWQKPLIYPPKGRKRAEVEFRDLERLDDNEFLNDNLIGFFLRFLEHDVQQNRPDLAKKMYFFNSYFFATLTNSSKAKRGINYEGVQKWTRGVNLFEHDFVIVPINENAHWYIALICNLPNLLPKPEAEQAENGERSQEATPEAVELADSGQDAGRAEDTSAQAEARSTAPGSPSLTSQPQQIAVDKTSQSMKDLSISDDDQAQQVPSDVNKRGSLLSRFVNRIRTMGSSQQEEPELEPGPAPPSPLEKARQAKARKAARKSGVGLQKYDTEAPIIITLDSLGLGRSPTSRALKEYVVEEARAKLGVEVSASSIRGMTAKGIPSQKNYSDCGLYLLAYMERFILEPSGFVQRILLREMDERAHWPVMESSDLRDRLRSFLLDFHKAQENGEAELSTATIGRILLGEPRRTATRRSPSKPSDDSTVSKYFQEGDILSIDGSSGCQPAAVGPGVQTNRSSSTERAETPTRQHQRAVAATEEAPEVEYRSPRRPSTPHPHHTTITIDNDDAESDQNDHGSSGTESGAQNLDEVLSDGDEPTGHQRQQSNDILDMLEKELDDPSQSNALPQEEDDSVNDADELADEIPETQQEPQPQYETETGDEDSVEIAVTSEMAAHDAGGKRTQASGDEQGSEEESFEELTV